MKTQDNTTQILVPDPEVIEKPKRRKFSASYKLQTIEKLDELKGTGEIGAYLRAEGLYASQVHSWRASYDDGGFDALKPQRRGRTAMPTEQKGKNAQLKALELEVTRLRKKLAKAEAIIDVQKKVAALLSMD